MNPNIPKRESTFLESDEDIRAAIAARKLGVKPTSAPDPKPAIPKPAAIVPTPETAPTAGWIDVSPKPAPLYEPQLFQPTNRPPMASLCVLDDLGEDGTWHRLMKDRIVIGRTEGDIQIPHDAMISTKHAELIRQKNRENWRWILSDLGSTNGSFVRVGSGILHNRQEFLIGRTHYRFDSAKGESTVPAEKSQSGMTVSWQDTGALAMIPSIVELTPQGEGQRIPITTSEIWIGRDPHCQVIPKEDPFANGKHARIYRDAKGRWFIVNNKSLNGVWVRVEQIPLEGNCQFLLGEQRFKMQAG
ncbi:FHA domain-containing protein [Telmatocola sphagniphila]|uniref:FHA domain-containing protein n=1 Tax=Telmatocola sphagniphila TaxID=1123043 RepID=A0A8E6B7R0_9BACT|nr:FHA domain-containing protein [Telmatocola sphagniphila]QVL32676.1 FHA domain-containing protein [Telmatocola sphagniphila]